MKTLYNTLKIFAGFFLLAILAVSCVPKQETMGDAGQTLVRMTPDGFKLIPLDAVATSQKATAFIVRKDPANEADLTTTTTVVVQKDDAMLTAYNTANGTTFIPLPTTLATTNPAPAADGTITLEYAAGDFAKAFVVTVPNATKFDFSKQYALGYRLTTISGAGTFSATSADSVIVQVMVKNRYDGTYEVSAITPMVDVLNATLTGYYPFIYELWTTGAHSVLCYDRDVYGDFMHPITSGTAVSGYGSFGLEVFFNTNGDGTIINVLNPWGNPPGNTRMPAIDPSGVNKWFAATGDVQFKYWMKQPSLVPAAPNIRTSFNEYWTRKGPR
ncbi:MAG: DUF1735 domain-containing protein [Bacteroidia bacterium]|nr:DUF1735 domain-containing protein [Bacteroidia bacterium]